MKMKKSVVLCAGVCAALALTGCKSSESAYKKAYLKAQAQQESQQTEAAESETPVVAPIVEKPVTQYRQRSCSFRKCYSCKRCRIEGLQCCCWFILPEGKCGRTAEYSERCRI